MKRLMYVAALALALAAPSAALATGGKPDANGDGRIDYGEAKAAGLRTPPLPAEVGKRACTHADFARHGFPTAEAAERSLVVHDLAFGEDGGPGDCYADPRTGTDTILPKAGAAGRYPVYGGGGWPNDCTRHVPYYRYVLTSHCPTNVEGIRATFEIGNPSLPHCYPGDCANHKHLYVRIESATSAGNNVQVGWDEGTDEPSGQWPLWVWTPAGQGEQLHRRWTNLDNGAYYPFRIRHDGPAGGGGALVVEYYNGGWIELDQRNDWQCQNADGSGNCSGLSATEVASENLDWFNVNAPVDGPGVNHRNIQLRVNPSDWRLFEPGNFSAGYGSQEDPYQICGYWSWYQFRTPKDSC